MTQAPSSKPDLASGLSSDRIDEQRNEAAEEFETETQTRRPADSSERAYQAIRQMLVEFRLRPEERINEVRLATSLGLSRTPVREALNRLASDGFVTATPNRGFFVRALSIEGLLDLYELRIIIECSAFRLMCERAEDGQIAQLSEYWSDIEPGTGTRDPDQVLMQDERFHLLIAQGSGNPEIVAQLASINARIRFIRRVQIEHEAHDENQITAHRAIAEAARRRDAEAGVEILERHIQMTVAATKLALKDALLKAFAPGQELSHRRKAPQGLGRAITGAKIRVAR